MAAQLRAYGNKIPKQTPINPQLMNKVFKHWPREREERWGQNFRELPKIRTPWNCLQSVTVINIGLDWNGCRASTPDLAKGHSPLPHPIWEVGRINLEPSLFGKHPKAACSHPAPRSFVDFWIGPSWMYNPGWKLCRRPGLRGSMQCNFLSSVFLPPPHKFPSHNRDALVSMTTCKCNRFWRS